MKEFDKSEETLFSLSLRNNVEFNESIIEQVKNFCHRNKDKIENSSIENNTAVLKKHFSPQLVKI